ncbi:MAG: tetratricopeptide repeat protein [Chloroherpetonaceae bacterium]
MPNLYLSDIASNTSISDKQHAVQSLIQQSCSLVNADVQKALSLSQDAQVCALGLDFPFGVACALVQQAICRFHLTEYDVTLQLAHEAMERFNMLSDDFGKAVCLKTMGCVYASFSQPQKALEYFLSSLSLLLPLSEEHLLGKKTNELGIVTTNIGACYQNLRDYEQSLSYYLKAMDYLSQTTDTVKMSSCATNLGALHSTLNLPDKAIAWLERAIEYARQSNNTSALVAALINISEVYRKDGHHHKCLAFLQEAIDVVKETGEQRHLDHLYIALSGIYEQLGDYPQALAYHKKYVEVTEKQFGKQMAEKIKALEIKFALDEAKKNAQLAEQSEKIKQLEEMVTICAWSGKIKMGDKWVRVEEFLQKKFGFKVSHGITEAMAEKLRQQYNMGKSL